MVRVYTDYEPVRILYNIDGSFEENAEKSGLCGSFIVCEESDLPQSREYREAWKVEGGKVIVCPEKSKAIWESRVEKHNKISKALEKLGISKEEFRLLMGA